MGVHLEVRSPISSRRSPCDTLRPLSLDNTVWVAVCDATGTKDIIMVLGWGCPLSSPPHGQHPVREPMECPLCNECLIFR